MQILNTDSLSFYRTKKTKGLRAKHTSAMFADTTMLDAFLVSTLEAKEPVRRHSMFCVGEANDVWQQNSDKLLKKYTIETFDSDGWMYCSPKPENEVECSEVTEQLWLSNLARHIQGHWGETIDGHENLQAYKLGDFILRDSNNTADVWIVDRKIFLNTYSLV